jgi:hypothetical protein
VSVETVTTDAELYDLPASQLERAAVALAVASVAIKRINWPAINRCLGIMGVDMAEGLQDGLRSMRQKKRPRLSRYERNRRMRR